MLLKTYPKTYYSIKKEIYILKLYVFSIQWCTLHAPCSEILFLSIHSFSGCFSERNLCCSGSLSQLYQGVCVSIRSRIYRGVVWYSRQRPEQWVLKPWRRAVLYSQPWRRRVWGFLKKLDVSFFLFKSTIWNEKLFFYSKLWKRPLFWFHYSYIQRRYSWWTKKCSLTTGCPNKHDN